MQAASMVFRTAHWPVPRKLLNLVPFKVSRNYESKLISCKASKCSEYLQKKPPAAAPTHTSMIPIDFAAGSGQRQRGHSRRRARRLPQLRRGEPRALVALFGARADGRHE